jgi:phosphatidylglycerophosphate synthase
MGLSLLQFFIFLIHGKISLKTYITKILDNMDGKQARRTKTSSALGMMFDHGCDALTTFVFTQGLSTIVGLGK